MKRFFSEDRMNKAALILSSYSPDVVEDILDLLNSRGRAVMADLFQSADAPMRANAIFSRKYISDEDFPEVFLGYQTTQIAQFRGLGASQDYYQKVLMGAFAIPEATANELAAKIDTLDILGVPNASGLKDWIHNSAVKFSESARKLLNWLPKVFHLGWEVDQRQDYDTDFLYELKLLGRTVDELGSRARLQGSQARIHADFNLFNGASGVYGDIVDMGYGDASDAAQLALANTVHYAGGNRLPEAMYGAYGGILSAGVNAVKKLLQGIFHKKGQHGSASGAEIVTPQNALMKQAGQSIVEGNPSALIVLAGSDAGAVSKLKAAFDAIKGASVVGDVDTLYGDIADAYGDAMADMWRDGDVPGLMNTIISAAGEPMETTGDPRLDEELAVEVLGDAEWTALEEASGPEVGGLFKKMRLRKKIKKANREGRRAAKFEAKENAKNMWAAKMAAAELLRAENSYNPNRVRSVDSYLQEMLAARANTEASADNMQLQAGPGVDPGMFEGIPSPTVNDDFVNNSPDSFGLDQFSV